MVLVVGRIEHLFNQVH